MRLIYLFFTIILNFKLPILKSKFNNTQHYICTELLTNLTRLKENLQEELLLEKFLFLNCQLILFQLENLK
jgi:hypothetical protein